MQMISLVQIFLNLTLSKDISVKKKKEKETKKESSKKKKTRA